MTSCDIDSFTQGMKAFRNKIPFDPTQDYFWREGWNEEQERALVKHIVRILKG
jgi:hypothetical protein